MIIRILDFIENLIWKRKQPTPVRVPNHVYRSPNIDLMYGIYDEQSRSFGYDMSGPRYILNPVDGSIRRIFDDGDDEPKLAAKKIVRNLPEWF